MSKFRKPTEKHHLVRLEDDDARGELLLVGKGRMAYLWVGNYLDKPQGLCTFSGPKTLRKLARHILATVKP